MKEWYQQTKEELLEHFRVTEHGLTGEEASKRLAEKGENVLEEGSQKHPSGFLSSSVTFGGHPDHCRPYIHGKRQCGKHDVIIAVIVLNAILGTVQHAKAEKSLDSLKSLSSPSTKVMRDGHKIELPSAQVVPGDILYLDAGTWWLPTEGYWKIIPCRSMKAPLQESPPMWIKAMARSMTTAPWQTGLIWYIPAAFDLRKGRGAGDSHRHGYGNR